MDIYNKSLETLKKLVKNQKKYDYKFYLIGGWAVWAYNPYMKSKDLDIIVDKKDLWKLTNFLLELGFRKTSDVLKKEGFAMLIEDDKIEIDVYDEKLGKWRTNELIKNSIGKKVNGEYVNVISVSRLFLLKAYTAMERLGTPKGEKDLSDIMALLDSHHKNIDFLAINKELDLKALFKILLSDFKQTVIIYPLSYEKYKEIKTDLKKLRLI
jgi:predicted nucleotidyltransferase